MGFDYRTATGLGKQTLGGHKQNIVCTRIWEKVAVTPQETDPDFPVSVQESLAKVWVGGGQLQGWGHCSFLLGPGAHKVLFVPSKSLFLQSCGTV